MLVDMLGSVCVLVLLAHCCHGNVGKWDVFNIKTPYIWAHHDVSSDLLAEEGRSVVVDNETCMAVHVNMVVRHGAKSPSTYKLRKITNLYERLLPFKDGPKYHEISNWANPFTKETASMLVPMGHREQRNLGDRTAKRFHHLFTHHGQNVKFVSSSKTRAIDSSRYFYEGIKKSFDSMKFHKNDINNRVLRFYDRCRRRKDFRKDLGTNPWYYEILEFEKRPEFVKIQDSLKTRLGLNFSLSAGKGLVLLVSLTTAFFSNYMYLKMTNGHTGVVFYSQLVAMFTPINSFCHKQLSSSRF